MTPAEKAYELVLKFQFKQEGVRKELAKRCALIAVGEIIEANPTELLTNPYSFYSNRGYWAKVRQEIEQL
jgi:hypothetical protein